MACFMFRGSMVSGATEKMGLGKIPDSPDNGRDLT